MSGTNPVSKFALPISTTNDAATYKANIDASVNVAKRVIDNFAPRQSNTPAMTVTVDAGSIFEGVTLSEVAAQTTGTITAPMGNPRIDRVVIDWSTGAISVITGTPASSPVAPAIATGKMPIAQVLLQTTSTIITNAMITDERNFWGLPSSVGGALQKANNLNDVASPAAALGNIGGAPLNNPALTGTPTAPTAAPGTNTNQIATMAALLAMGGSYIGTQYLGLSSGTYTPTAGTTRQIVFMWGGGGGGGGSGSGGSGNPGGNGGTTSLGTITAPGGKGGDGVNQSGGTGGVAGVNGSISLPGSSGGNGQPIISGSVNCLGGDGAPGMFGMGAGAGGLVTAGGGGSGTGVGSAGGTAAGGGGGSGNTTLANGAGGGGQGAFTMFTGSILSAVAYVNGAGGVGGSAGSSGFSGAPGGSGFIMVLEFS